MAVAGGRIVIGAKSLGLLDSGGLGLSSDGGDGGDSGEETCEGADHGGVVDDVMGGVGCHVLLDGDLGHVLDGVVDIVADVLDDRGGGHCHRGGVVSGNSWSGNNLSSGGGDDSVDSGGGDCVGGDSGGLDNRGSSDNWGVVDNRDNSLANGVDEAVLVEILRKTLEGERSVALGCCDQATDSGGEGARGGALIDVRGGRQELGVSSGGSQAGAHHSEESDLGYTE